VQQVNATQVWLNGNAEDEPSEPARVAGARIRFFRRAGQCEGLSSSMKEASARIRHP
jgi:hypothetical protein